MALQVWLPLRGDVNNYGLSPAQFYITDTTTITANANGKLGSCYSFSGYTGAGIRLNVDSISVANFMTNYIDNKSFSIACWVYPTVTGSTAICSLTYSIRFLSNLFMDLNFPTLPANKWSHVVGTWNTDTLEKKVYVNGVELVSGTGSGPFVHQYTNAICIGRDTNNITAQNYYFFLGSLNDFRIYDHCLSPKEVHDLALGLVLHYKLDGGVSYNFAPELTLSNYTQNNYKDRTSSTIVNGVYHVDGYLSSTSIDTSYYIASNSYITLNPNTTYYLSFWCKSKSDNSLYFSNASSSLTVLRDSSNVKYYPQTPVNIGTQYNDWVVLMITTGTPTQYKLHIGFDTPNIYGIGSFIEFSNITLSLNPEKGIPYGYTPIIYDSSGYNNDGTIVNTPTVTSSSPRYNVATSLANNSTIKVNDNNWLSQGMLLMTINIWAKATNWAAAHLFSCTESGGFNTEAGNSGYLKFPIHVYTNAEKTTTAYLQDKDAIKISDLSTTDWVMFTFVYTTSGTKTYLNGQLHHENNATSYGIHFNTNARLFLGCEASGANPSAPYFTGQLSDFRIYTTVLSDDDILDLYKVGASVDNKLNFYTYEIEENGIGRIGKNGVSQFDVLEANDECKIYKLVNSNLFLEEPRSINPTVYLAYLLNMSENLVAGETYTMLLWDVDMTGSASSQLLVYWGGGNTSLFSWYVSSNFTNGHADHLVKTFTVTSSQARGVGSTNLWLNLYNYPSSSTDKNMYIGAWKLEKGSAATPLLAGDKLYDTTVQCNQLIEI